MLYNFPAGKMKFHLCLKFINSIIDFKFHSIHICVTFLHTKPGMAEKFVNDVELTVKEIMQSPEKMVEGKFAIYGVAQSLPDRSIVGDFTRLYLDSMYFTPKKLIATNN